MGEGLLNMSRRRFLVHSASMMALGAATLALPKAHAEEPKAPEDPMRVPGALPRPYGERSPFIKSSRVGGAGPGAPHGWGANAPNNFNSWTPLQDLHGIVTPSALHFERHHNGVPLIDPSRHRLLIHGLVKRPKFGTAPFMTREETSKYTDLMPDGKAYQFSLVMEAKSVITSPSGQQQIQPGFQEIRGLAWSGRGRVTKAEVSVDGGRTWQLARLQEPVLPKCHTRFLWPWRWNGRETILQSRCTDETGYVQPTRQELVKVRGNNSVFHYNAIQSWRVDRDGRIWNIYA